MAIDAGGSAASFQATAATILTPMINQAQYKVLVHNLILGKTWAQAKTALLAAYPSVDPACLDAFQAQATTDSTANPPIWNDLTSGVDANASDPTP